MKQHRVLLTDPIAPGAAKRIAQRADVILAPDNSPATLIEAATDTDIIVVRSPLPTTVFKRAPRLRGVIRHGAGVDMIPVDTASAHHVAVANVPGANATSVAEYALGQILNLSHLHSTVDTTLRVRGWQAARALVARKVEVSGRTLGMVGTGNIGLALAAMAHQGFGMKVVGYHPRKATVSELIEMVSLETLFAQSDFIVLACPLNSSTQGMISAEILAKMKSNAVLINVSRGPVVDESALIQALKKQQIKAAALDVFDEQPLPADSPLMRMDNVLLSSHMAGLTQDSFERIGNKVADQVLQLLDGELPTHLCNADIRTMLQVRLQELI